MNGCAKRGLPQIAVQGASWAQPGRRFVRLATPEPGHGAQRLNIVENRGRSGGNSHGPLPEHIFPLSNNRRHCSSFQLR